MLHSTIYIKRYENNSICVCIHGFQSIKYGRLCMFVCLRREDGRKCVNVGDAVEVLLQPFWDPHRVMGLGFPPPAVATSEISTAQPQPLDPSPRGFATASPSLAGRNRDRAARLWRRKAAVHKPPSGEAGIGACVKDAGRFPVISFVGAGWLVVAVSIYLVLLKKCLYSL